MYDEPESLVWDEREWKERKGLETAEGNLPIPESSMIIQ